MTAKDQVKLINVGFVIIRMESVHRVSHTYDHRIKFKSREAREWKTLENCESKAQMERRCTELLKGPMTVMD